MKLRTAIAAALFLSLCLPALGQTPGVSSGLPALRYIHPTTRHTSAWALEYMGYDREPAFRIEVHHYHAWCNGYLYFTPTRIIYDPALTPFRKDGFSAKRTDITALNPRSAGLEFHLGDVTQKFAFISQPIAAVPAARDERTALMQFVELLGKDFAAAQQQFLRQLAGLNGAEGAAFGAQPVINILEPAGASANATVNSPGPLLHVYGVAGGASGIRSVTVNGQPAKLVPLSPQLVEFESSPAPMNPVSNPVSVTAQASDNAQAQIAFNVIRPDIRVAEPPVGYQSSSPAVTVHGTVFGMHDIRRVNIGGVNANLVKRNDGGVDFDAPNVPLQIGMNTIPGFVSRADGQDDTFTVAARRLPPGPPPLTLPAILSGLRVGVSQQRIIALIGEKGVDFALTEDAEKLLRAAGAQDPLMEIIAKNRR
jgi:hypothetical protein